MGSPTPRSFTGGGGRANENAGTDSSFTELGFKTSTYLDRGPRRLVEPTLPARLVKVGVPALRSAGDVAPLGAGEACKEDAPLFCCGVGGGALALGGGGNGPLDASVGLVAFGKTHLVPSK